MDTTVRGVSSCRHCQFYKMEGRRGGFCHQLGVLVQGRWRACTFATPLFATSVTPRFSEGEITADVPQLVYLQEALEEAIAAEPFMPLEEYPNPISGLIASNS